MWEEFNRNRQEVSRSEKRLKDRTDEHLAKNLSRMTREAEQRQLRLRDDVEKLRIQQEQVLETLDTKIDAMMERRTQTIMDRLDGLPRQQEWVKKWGIELGRTSREPRVNFNEQQNRRRTLEEGPAHQGMPQGTIEHGAQTSEEAQLATDRPQTNDRRKIHMQLGDVIPGTGVMRVKEEIIPAIRTGGKIQFPYQGEMILRGGGIQETLHQWPQPLNL